MFYPDHLYAIMGEPVGQIRKDGGLLKGENREAFK
jgi:hypothetical protein